MLVKISEAQWVITYKCKLGGVTNYCVVPGHSPGEVDLAQKIEALNVLNKIGIKTLKFLGGNFEDMDIPEIKEIIITANNMGFNYVITTSGLNKTKIFKIIRKLKIKKGSGLFFSVDFLNPDFSIGGCSFPKTIAALKLIPEIKDDISVLGINTVINSKNLDELPKILRWITEMGGYMNICPLIWGDWKKFIYRTQSREYALRPEHRSKVDEITKKLVAMKHQGYHLACSDDYALKIGEVCSREDHFGWDCSNLSFCPILRVDANLSLMVCSDIKGSKISRFIIFDLSNSEKYELFLKSWVEDPDRNECCKNYGCYWSNIVRAVYNFDTGGSFTE